jgi:hypothetical protein
MSPFFWEIVIFIIKRNIMDTNRFKQLLESSLGNVKPLLSESMDEVIQWDIKSVDCEGKNKPVIGHSQSGNGYMGVDYEDDMVIVTIRYCKGDHKELEYLKKKARNQIETENQLPEDDGINL